MAADCKCRNTARDTIDTVFHHIVSYLEHSGTVRVLKRTGDETYPAEDRNPHDAPDAYTIGVVAHPVSAHDDASPDPVEHSEPVLYSLPDPTSGDMSTNGAYYPTVCGVMRNVKAARAYVPDADPAVIVVTLAGKCSSPCSWSAYHSFSIVHTPRCVPTNCE